jgi:hypothetical protein
VPSGDNYLISKAGTSISRQEIPSRPCNYLLLAGFIGEVAPARVLKQAAIKIVPLGRTTANTLFGSIWIGIKQC